MDYILFSHQVRAGGAVTFEFVQTDQKPLMELQQLESTATQIRRDIVRMVHGAQSGHPGGSLGCAEFFAALFFDQLDHRPDAFDMAGSGQDLFFQRREKIQNFYKFIKIFAFFWNFFETF